MKIDWSCSGDDSKMGLPIRRHADGGGSGDGGAAVVVVMSDDFERLAQIRQTDRGIGIHDSHANCETCREMRSGYCYDIANDHYDDDDDKKHSVVDDDDVDRVLAAAPVVVVVIIVLDRTILVVPDWIKFRTPPPIG